MFYEINIRKIQIFISETKRLVSFYNVKTDNCCYSKLNMYLYFSISSTKGIYNVKLWFVTGNPLFCFLYFVFFLSLVIPYPGAQLTSGQHLKLSCTTGEPLAPDMQLKWVFPQKSPRLPPDQHSPNLTFPEVRIDDSGNWECELWWNNTSLASAVIRLQIGEHRKREKSRK